MEGRGWECKSKVKVGSHGTIIAKLVEETGWGSVAEQQGERGGGEGRWRGGGGGRNGGLKKGDPCRPGRLSECGEAEVVRHVIPVL